MCISSRSGLLCRHVLWHFSSVNQLSIFHDLQLSFLLPGIKDHHTTSPAVAVWILRQNHSRFSDFKTRVELIVQRSKVYNHCVGIWVWQEMRTPQFVMGCQAWAWGRLSDVLGAKPPKHHLAPLWKVGSTIRRRIKRWIVWNLQMLIVSAVTICKQCLLQLLGDFYTPDPLGCNPPNEKSWRRCSLHVWDYISHTLYYIFHYGTLYTVHVYWYIHTVCRWLLVEWGKTAVIVPWQIQTSSHCQSTLEAPTMYKTDDIYMKISYRQRRQLHSMSAPLVIVIRNLRLVSWN